VRSSRGGSVSPATGASDWQLEDVRGTDDPVAVAFSWRTAAGSRTKWAQVVNLERGKIVAMQNYASRTRAFRVAGTG
jgi:hypothetical protein